MKPIPYEIRERLLKNVMAQSTDAEPRLRAIATQSTINTLLSEIIHKNTTAAYGDVCIRQLAGEKEPSLAYALCVDGGTATVYQRKFPAFRDNPWEQLWTLGAADEVAIEFHGTWKLDVSHKWHYLETEAVPYVFYTRAGTLYVQKWQDSATRVPLAEGVTEISVCRGWQSSDDPLLDQGLVIGYLREGRVFYRAFCAQSSGMSLWETEREVTELGSGNTSICVFRTNDFRVGFICENDGGFLYTLSARTYTGQSVLPETVYGQMVADGRLSVTQILYHDAFGGRETIAGQPHALDAFLGQYTSIPEFKAVSMERVGKRTFIMTMSHAVIERNPLVQFLSIVPDGGQNAPIPVSVVVNGTTITVEANEDVSSNGAVQIKHNVSSSLRFFAQEGNWFLAPAFTAVFTPDPPKADDETIQAILKVEALVALPIQYLEETAEEHLTVIASYSSALTAIQVGPVPV